MRDMLQERLLEDYVDGLLAPEEAVAVERKLADDPAGRETVAFLRSLKARAAALPATIEPARDLWPEVAAAMAPTPLVSVAAGAGEDRVGLARRRPAVAASTTGEVATIALASWIRALQPRQWAALAAAAMLLIVSSSGLTAWWLQGPGRATDAGRAASSTIEVAGADASPIPVELALQIDELMWILYDNRDSLDPDTVTTIETNLRVIDRAIRRAREALADDPGNAGLTRLLANSYVHKLQLLQRTSRIIERS